MSNSIAVGRSTRPLRFSGDHSPKTGMTARDALGIGERRDPSSNALIGDLTWSGPVRNKRTLVMARPSLRGKMHRG